MKVYVVYDGYCRHVEGVFSSLEKCNSYMKEQNCDYSVIELELDVPNPECGEYPDVDYN